MNRFNLLDDPWIPVRTVDGKELFISAYEISRKDILSLNAPRADFNAALFQLLIGLVQTVLAPESNRQWRERYRQPPTEKEFKEVFKPYKKAFYLDGEGPRFMQDQSIKEMGNQASILKLLPGLIGDITVKENKDFFCKASQMKKISISNLIIGLYLYQNYCLSESGGRNGRHHGSLRGRNTVATILIKDSGYLWENIWLNVLPKDKFKMLLSSELPLDHDTFKWMMPAITSDKKISDNKIGSLDIYWSTPRRVWVKQSDIKDGTCDLSGCISKTTEFIHIKENGIEYQTKFTKFPLMPYSRDSNGVYPVKMNSVGVTYGDWISITGSKTCCPVLMEHIRRDIPDQYTIFAFGYSNDRKNAKTLCWYQTRMPFYLPKTDCERELIENEVQKYIEASKKISDPSEGYLAISIRMAWFEYDYEEEKNKTKGRKPDPLMNKASNSPHHHSIQIAKCFFAATENQFYELLKNLNENSDCLSDEQLLCYRSKWHKHIKNEAINNFKRWAFKSGIQMNPRRIALAYNKLNQKLNGIELKRDVLGLP